MSVNKNHNSLENEVIESIVIDELSRLLETQYKFRDNCHQDKITVKKNIKALERALNLYSAPIERK